jgi:type VI protein secretion system component Hcp
MTRLEQLIEIATQINKLVDSASAEYLYDYITSSTELKNCVALTVKTVEIGDNYITITFTNTLVKVSIATNYSEYVEHLIALHESNQEL